MNSVLTEHLHQNKFAIIAVPCNQFGLQEPAANKSELMSGLAYVRPGNLFTPLMHMTGKMDVLGDKAHQMFKQISNCCIPTYKNTIGDPKQLFMEGLQRYTDIRWNFEKFLINPQGIPVRRYDPEVCPRQVYNDFLHFRGATR